MADAVYDKGREAFLSGDIDWTTDNIKVVLVDNSYTPNTSTDQYLSTILAGWRVDTSANLSSKTVSGGVADAADETISNVSGNDIYYIVIYKDTGTEATSPLIAVIDSATGLPYSPDGNDIEIIWDSGTNKIFKL
jgi:hypothetical protein